MTADGDEGRTGAPPGSSDRPEIGAGGRWYDQVYKAVDAGQRSRLWRRLPLRWRVWVSRRVMQRLLAEYQLDRYRAELDDSHPLAVSARDTVSVPTIWVVELFTATESARLEATLRRNRWQRAPHSYPMASSTDLLRDARSGSGLAWWDVVHLVDVNATHWIQDARVERLPAPFQAASVHVVQLGATTTAVVARMSLAPDAAGSVNKRWHEVAEPHLVTEANGLVRAEDRAWATMRATQQAQMLLHDAAREWLRGRLPGTFARSAVPQTTFALLLLDPGDPLDEEIDPTGRDRLRALGVIEPPTVVQAAQELPGLVTEQVRESLCPTLGATDVHILIGNLARVRQGVGPRAGHTEEISPTTIGHLVDSVELRNYMVLQAIGLLLQTLERRHASLRDQAVADHRRLSASAVKRLRSQLMTQALDLDSVDGALADFRARRDRDAQVTNFTFDLSEKVHRLDAAAGRDPFTPVDLVSRQVEQLSERIARLQDREKRLRDLLATVTELGTSADTFRLSRVALVVALVSFVVAIASLLIAEPGPTSLLQHLLDGLGLGIHLGKA